MLVKLFSILLGTLFVLTLSQAAPTSPMNAVHPLTKRYTGVKIQSNRSGLCLRPVGVRWGDGTQVNSTDCDIGAYWDINPGSGSVILTGTTLALDAGLGTENNEIVKLWTSYPGLFQQTWYLTDDNRIAITGGNQCLDEGDNGPQTYQCTTGNTNQIWYIVDDLAQGIAAQDATIAGGTA
ncbi:hypothetical protein CI109_106248 [Kwoniella shandongensis]|uniref:Ricin B lectin domain-containing protein n=1 Tax=Kwoniella shandongensis TaxID=1734106 RepID=A0A5M6C3X3_9TREE|nr:uncharacterized protein CI109_003851 [Kwoniella shandongensis]KAA5527879.1 hypothetical protein CI109_003851 [Kwoniella shandongensis]